MHIERIQVSNFRNIDLAEIELTPDVVLISGANGHGKTSLIEAVAYISRTKSFRTSKSDELIKLGRTEAFVSIDIMDLVGPINLSSVIYPRKKIFRINEKDSAGTSSVIGKLITIIFSPQDLNLITGSPDLRRGFIDRHLVDIFPQSLTYLVNYQKALKHKQKILKDYVSVGSQELEPWNAILAKNGAKITEYRDKFVSLLNSLVTKFYSYFSSDDQTASLTFNTKEYHFEEERLFEKLQKSLQPEIASQRALIGPHKDDLVYMLSDKNAQRYASQGQVRSLVLATKLGVTEMIENVRGDSPVILLDDVASELDTFRRHRFIDLLRDKPRQVLITGTELDEVKHLGRELSVLNGSFSWR